MFIKSTALLLTCFLFGKANADSLGDWAGDYDGALLFGGFAGSWGNAGSVNFKITCKGELFRNGAKVTDVTYSGGGALTWTEPGGATATITLSGEVQNDYFFRDLASYPDNTCTGQCFTGVYQPPGGSGAVDFRGDGALGASCGGDPHFKTWNNQWYDFHGVCDLVLVQASDFGQGLGLHIHLRTKGRHNYSYIESAAIKIGDSIMEFGSYGSYMVEGVSNAELPAMLADLYPVEVASSSDSKEHVFTIKTGPKEKIVVTSFKDMISVKFEKASFSNFQNSSGLMGKFGPGTKLGRDGTTLFEDDNAFGQEWQVLSTEPVLFQAPHHPSVAAGEMCVMPDPAATPKRRLGEGIPMEAAEKACMHWEEDKKDMCIFDLMTTGDFDFADAHGAY